jgi:hypothetical protein
VKNVSNKDSCEKLSTYFKSNKVPVISIKDYVILTAASNESIVADDDDDEENKNL